jgi:hypothetical protein
MTLCGCCKFCEKHCRCCHECDSNGEYEPEEIEAVCPDCAKG